MTEILKASFPVYSVTCNKGRLFAAGGGGSSKTGMRNGVDVFRLDTPPSPTPKAFVSLEETLPESVQSRGNIVAYGENRTAVVVSLSGAAIARTTYPAQIKFIRINSKEEILVFSENGAFSVSKKNGSTHTQKTSPDVRDVSFSDRYIVLAEEKAVSVHSKRRHARLPVPNCSLVQCTEDTVFTVSVDKTKKSSTVLGWKKEKGGWRPARKRTLRGCVTAFCVRSDTVAAATSDSTVYALSLRLRVRMERKTSQFAITSLDILPDTTLCTGSADGNIFLLKPQNKTTLFLLLAALVGVVLSQVFFLLAKFK
ncbi:MAG: uncharacterized protein A8A55_0108 [Amphiamblys sp. WSBS2006]|nr:MAG: uncharacterized protein A8A55_0108 [Amphiamblys sp. WSBS2006]